MELALTGALRPNIIYPNILFVGLFFVFCFFFLDFILKRYKFQLKCFFGFFFKLINLFIFIFGCVGSSFLYEGFLQLRRAGATLHRGARASHHRGLSCCGAQAPDVQAQQLWLTGPVAPRHVGSSQTRAQTHVPCIGSQILNHCATWEATVCFFKANSLYHFWS